MINNSYLSEKEMFIMFNYLLKLAYQKLKLSFLNFTKNSEYVLFSIMSFVGLLLIVTFFS